MKITRHYLTINGNQGSRRVHYRRCGNGPPLLMIHQSPKSSAEYEPLMRVWGKHFTCIAPDTPGFGQSDTLAIENPDINDFADAIVEFGQNLGLKRCAAYGFHSGGIILVTALRRHMEYFTGLGVGGYAVWTPKEMALFSDSYLPEFHPSDFGEHLTWLWNRVLEQSWFFPWFDSRKEARLSVAHAEPARVHGAIMDMLDAGNAYQAGYAAILRAKRDIPPADSITPPVLITAYNGDPLQEHLDRLGDMPQGWQGKAVGTPQEQQAENLEFLLGLDHPSTQEFKQDSHQGFLETKTGAFDGLIHWQGNVASGRLHLHAPGKSLELLDTADCVAIDLPGHGLSDGWQADVPTDWAAWQEVIDAVANQLKLAEVRCEPLPAGDAEELYPDLTPDRFGNYLTNAWRIVRSRQFFAPWYEMNAAHAIDFDQSQLAPASLALEHRSLVRAFAAKEYHIAQQENEGNLP